MRRARGGGLLGLLLILGAVARAWAADPVAVLTEIRAGKGEVRVRRAGTADWIAPQPLLALRPEDQVRVTEDGRAVLAFTGGGTQTVSAGNSPFTVQAPRADSTAARAGGLLKGVTQFLLGQQKEPTYQALSVRGGPGEPPQVLGPRDTRVMPGPVTFEWTGPRAGPYRIRLSGPQGPVWELGDLARQPIDYPASAPPLEPASRYSWTLEAPGQPVQRAEFETLSAADAARVRAGLANLEPSVLAGYPPGTVVVLRVAYLVQAGLYAEARRELLAGIAADRDEATLHVLLAQVYEHTGLGALAAQEFDEAQFLATRNP